MPDKLKEFVRETLAEMLEERLKGMSAEERLKGISMEEFVRSLSPETREALSQQLKGHGPSANPQ